MNRLEFYIRENLPRGAARVSQENLVTHVTQDLLSTGVSVNLSDIHNILDELNQKQYIVLFADGTVSMTAHGEHFWSKK